MEKKKSTKRKTQSIDQVSAALEELRRRIDELELTLAEHTQPVDVSDREVDYRTLLDESSDPIFSFYPNGQYRYANKAFALGVGKTVEEIIGKKIWDVFPKDEADKRFAAVQWVFETGEIKVIEVRVPRPDGDTYYITTIKPILNRQKEPLSVICISKEITERKRMEMALQRLSTHDILTGLYNRNFFETEVARIEQGRLFPIGVVVGDLDNLKKINDRYGHQAGDELITKVSQLLRQSFRGEDIVARIGGDEFAVLLPGMDEKATQATVARLRSKIAKMNDPLIQLSLGMAICEGTGCNLSDTLRLADDRMYQDKAVRKKNQT